MPGRMVTVTVRAWALALAFFMVTAAFVAATVIATKASNRANATAKQAKIISIRLRENIEATKELRRKQLETVQKIANASCSARHVIVSGQIVAYEQAITQAQAFLRGPGGQLPGVRDAELKSIALVQRLLVKLHKADCHSVPSILHPRKKSGTP